MFFTQYSNPPVEPEVFTKDNTLTDTTAYEPLDVTIARQMEAGILAREQNRGVYEFVGDGFVDMSQVRTTPYYAPDMVDASVLYESARSVYDNASIPVDTPQPNVSESAPASEEV